MKKGYKIFVALSLCLMAAGCSLKPSSENYRQFYSYLRCKKPFHKPMGQSDCFLVILVEARHLDYTENSSFLKTLAKHPSDGSKNGDVGHAWIYLKKTCGSKSCILEGGHSGERGIFQPKYFEGVLENVECGAKDPIRYLFCPQDDGFFQQGSGGHDPTYAAKVDLTEEQYQAILGYIGRYNYHSYSLTERQCSTFAAEVAGLAGLNLEDKVTMAIQQEISLEGKRLRLWNNPNYSQITFASPDILEKSLMEAVQEGRAEYALKWYQTNCRQSFLKRLQGFGQTFIRFPGRIERYLQINNSK